MKLSSLSLLQPLGENIPKAGTLTNNKHLFLTILEAGSTKIEVSAGRSLLRPLCLVAGAFLPCESSIYPSSVHRSPNSSFSQGHQWNRRRVHSHDLTLTWLLLYRKWKGESVSRSVVSDSLWPHELLPARLLCPWNSPGKNTGVSSPFPSPGNLPNPGIEPRSPAL